MQGDATQALSARSLAASQIPCPIFQPAVQNSYYITSLTKIPACPIIA
jgi:hypothetical protein